MLMNEEVHKSRLLLGDKFLYEYENSEQWCLEFTCGARKDPHLDFIPSHVEIVPVGTVSDDLKFLSKTNKRYAELGSTEKAPQLENHLTDSNDNNNNKIIPSYMDIQIPTDCTSDEADDDFETLYDTATGETKVRLGSYEYIIDITSHFAETENIHYSTNTDRTAALGFEDEETIGVLPTVATHSDEMMFDGYKEQGDVTYSNHVHWNPEKRVLGNIDSRNTMNGLEYYRKPEDFTRQCALDDLSNENNQIDRPASPINSQSSKSATASMKSEIQTNSCVPNAFEKLDFAKTLPCFASLNDTKISDSNETITPNVQFNRYSREGRWKGSEQSEPLYSSVSDCTNDADLLGYQETLLLDTPHTASHHQDTAFENVFDRTLNEDKICFNSKTLSSACNSSKFVPADQYHRSSPQRDEMKDNRSHHNAFPAPTCSDVSTQHLHFYRFTQCEEMGKRAASAPVDHQLNEHLFESTGYNSKTKWKRGCRLWEYIRNLLLDPSTNPDLIKWVDRDEGTFRLVQNKTIAHMWGMKKGNGDMSYEKLSRAMRYYYKKQIFQPVIGKRLVYKFGPRATGWKKNT